MAATPAHTRLAELLASAPLYAILDTLLRPDSLAALEPLLIAGVKVVQYRHKGQFRSVNYDACCQIAEKVHQHGGLFLVNDRADVAALCGADGVHLGQDDLPPAKARALLGDSRIIGYSTHNPSQFAAAASELVDYLAIGPMFATTTKQNPDPVVSLETVTRLRGLTSERPLVAIGGITLENAAKVIASGADAVAVVSALILAPDVQERARHFLSVLRSASRSKITG